MARTTRISDFLKSERGSFTIYAAFAFPIFLAALGFGLDYWSALSVKARLDAAADTAAVAAVRFATNYMQTYGASMTGAQLQAAAIAAGQVGAFQSFNANAGASQPLTQVTPSISINYANRTYTATVSYHTIRPTSFAGILGVNSLGIGGTATASQKQLTYINVYVLVDTSQSMGIAANAAQMSALYSASAPYNPDGGGTTVGCVFGCHVAQNTSVSMEQVAHANNINLRIDVARAAIYNMAQSAQSEAVANNIQFAVYGLQDNPNTGSLITEVYPTSGLTNNYTALMSAMSPTSYILDLGSNTSAGIGDSKQDSSLATFAASLPKQGDGSSAGSPLNYVYIVTDGMIDYNGSGSNCTWNHCMNAIPSSACSEISGNATVGVIYTTYVNIYTHDDPSQGLDYRFSALVEPYIGFVPGNLESCSSGSGWFYQATDDTALLNAMNSLFASTLSVARITN